jgi:ribonuclease VapC
MIIDSSAVAAVLLGESDAANYVAAIESAEICRISAATYVEASIVIEFNTRHTGGRDFDAFLRRAHVVIEPVTEEQAHIARQAYADFGRGQHKAGLNFGDCFAYALARATGEPLLFKGRDFRNTDVTSAI